MQQSDWSHHIPESGQLVYDVTRPLSPPNTGLESGYATIDWYMYYIAVHALKFLDLYTLFANLIM